MFRSLLIANRGEIACRVIASARALGLRTIAVQSSADAGARHVRLADEAHLIGPPPARESYLSIDAILEAARASGAEAVHPGYGFLAENAEFAEAVIAAGLVWVGPPPSAIRAMGLKDAAKALMVEADVPVVPGFQGDDQSAERLAAAAAEIGFPVMIKPVAGGGGKGMRVVASAAEFPRALDGAKREAAAAFGDERVLLERYLPRPRHVEIQVFADTHGNVVHLNERDCSVQRRHQKVVEEAPAPGMSATLRHAMGEAARAAARAIGYVGAGTLEFLLDEPPAGGGDPAFYFMEMNTRLQVEHPVTEMITGLDLVALQLRVAAGEPLGFDQGDVRLDGHAIEVRLYAEDPAKRFLPSTGTLSMLRLPKENGHVRVDTGVAEGDAVTVHYDPMIAKLIVWDRDRPSALARLDEALRSTAIVGVASNVAFLRRLLRVPDFAEGRLDTGMVEREKAALTPPAEAAPDRVLALACLLVLRTRAEAARADVARRGDPHSPWGRTDAWRPNLPAVETLVLEEGGKPRSVLVRHGGASVVLDLPGGPCTVGGKVADDGGIEAELDGVRVRAFGFVRGLDVHLVLDGVAWRFALPDPLNAAETVAGGGAAVIAPMPGKVVQVLVEAGKRVAKGTPVIVLEAMKMEHALAAPSDLEVAEVACRPGDQVAEGAVLVTFAES
jgi:3-methylcrotonyl-CoA carboxylase alpha subunit